jgi:integrase
MANAKSKSLNDLLIKKLKRPASKKWIRDGDGLALCLSPSVSNNWRSWYYIYTSPETGKKIYKPLGIYPDVTLSAARDAAALLRSDILKGNDPKADEKRAAEERARADQEILRMKELEEKAVTVTILFEDYMTRHAKLNKRESSWREDERLFKVNVEPSWGKRKAADIKKRDCIALLDGYADRPALCHNVMKLTRKMLNFAVEKDILEHTPFTGVKVPVELESRERILSEAEVRKLWMTELPKAGMSDAVKRIIKLLLLTGQRVGEVCGITPDEIEGHWWTLPPERTKNGQTHRVYLTDMAIELLGTPINGYYFLSPVTKTDDQDNPIYNYIDGNAVANAIRKNLKDYQPRRPIKGERVSMVQVPEEKKMELAHFTPHDLRRTFSTFLAQLGFSDEIINIVTNHKKQGVISIYNRYKYDKEKQQALEAWEQKLISIITVDNGNSIVLTAEDTDK